MVFTGELGEACLRSSFIPATSGHHVVPTGHAYQRDFRKTVGSKLAYTGCAGPIMAMVHCPNSAYPASAAVALIYPGVS